MQYKRKKKVILIKNYMNKNYNLLIQPILVKKLVFLQVLHLRDKTMADESNVIPNDDIQYPSSVDFNHWLKRLDT